ncbi:toxin-antitoxin system, antitoxin component, Xre family [Peptoanaerobacter stomatis]|uniref:Toxin-antitoxin system, antitoxin component, Xre family n=1 Tax=Peptoanaerobacter stomatis TaxID=796937 RepID=J5W9I8_9FIRM|nr:helix-turn-helix transcriptional regulator [Peptoanaerobacter stomatis]EJU20357.1 toxin-antitoxin system, antitoxin component, Xre family [Peptoanaerobacter stomatis]
MVLSIYGVKVKKRLVEIGMTQKELAEKVGTSEVYLSFIISGKKGGWKYREKIDEILDNTKSRRVI